LYRIDFTSQALNPNGKYPQMQSVGSKTIHHSELRSGLI